MSQYPLCIAPWASILIDTDKSVKPCCGYGKVYNQDEFLTNKTLQEIVNGETWTDLKNKLKNNEWPTRCAQSCKRSEERSGWSPRSGYQAVHFRGDIYTPEITDYESGAIRNLEFNGSNICNLACLHCSPTFSSKWIPEWKKVFPNDPEKYKSTLPDPELIINNLKQLDLSKLQDVMFKGGEPMYNDETLVVLEYLDSLGILPNVKVNMFTNASVLNEKIVALLSKARGFVYTVSIDGPGKLNEYIRYKDSSIENILSNIEKIDALENSFICFSMTTMVYNIFSLVELRDMWLDMKKKYNVFDFPFFNLVVSYPYHLHPSVLSDKTRHELIEYYTKNQIKDEFKTVIKTLEQPYAGDARHNEWVNYTKKMESLRSNSIIDLVPQLADELILR